MRRGGTKVAFDVSWKAVSKGKHCQTLALIFDEKYASTFTFTSQNDVSQILLIRPSVARVGMGSRTSCSRPRPDLIEAKATSFGPRAVLEVEDSPRGPHHPECSLKNLNSRFPRWTNFTLLIAHHINCSSNTLINCN